MVQETETPSTSQKDAGSLKQALYNLDPKLKSVFLPWVFRHPRYLRAAPRLVRAHRQARQIREQAAEEGLQVPPFLILSITSRCNLSCTGCFAAATGTVANGSSPTDNNTKPSLSIEQWRAIIQDASKLGVFGFIIAGGEPFLFPGLIDLCLEFKDRFFVILTNGTAIKEPDLKCLKRATNIAVLVSIEGSRELTDVRRGSGVYDRALQTLKQIDKVGVANGISVTITRMNFRYWMDERNIEDLISNGIRIGAFIEYIPLTPLPDIKSNSLNQPLTSCTALPEALEQSGEWSIQNDHELMLTAAERAEFRAKILSFRKNKPIYIVHSPGDEEFFGGCVSAGRGFAHITPSGDLTPCPVSNIATHNLTKSSLTEGLASPLFKEICANEHLLENGDTPCALFAHPKEVDELAKAVGAYRTGE
ncbi:MAG: radical SAM protein [Thermoplasmata archaeon]|nr:MAG: radical SAM protein [Thermoplasmata archaeon]